MAMLVDHFHLSLDEIRRLTARQISDIYFHKRGDTGTIEIPRFSSPEEELETFRKFNAKLGNSIDAEAVEQEIRQRWKNANPKG